MDENKEKTFEAESVIVEDCVAVPRAEYYLLRDSVATLKSLRTILLATNIPDYARHDACFALLFPEKVLPLKEDKDA